MTHQFIKNFFFFFLMGSLYEKHTYILPFTVKNEYQLVVHYYVENVN